MSAYFVIDFNFYMVVHINVQIIVNCCTINVYFIIFSDYVIINYCRISWIKKTIVIFLRDIRDDWHKKEHKRIIYYLNR